MGGMIAVVVVLLALLMVPVFLSACSKR